MKLALSFADSEVADLDASGRSVHIRLSAAHVFRRDTDDGKPLEGFARSVRIVLQGARLAAPPDAFIGRIAQGRIGVGGGWTSEMPLPGSIAGPLQVELALYNHTQLTLSADAIECRFEGEANFAESLFC